MILKEWINAGKPLNSFISGDCMEGMGQFPDNYFDLAIVDPPYGIKIMHQWGSKHSGYKQYERKEWDNEPPELDYFIELRRVSKNQIIWGGNYFTDKLPVSQGRIIWDKGQREFSFADGELAWTSFDKALRFTKARCRSQKEERIHINQKPIQLYRWILVNYGQAGWKILDTHVGSGSSLIACEREGFKYVGFEIDPDYYKAAMERIKRERQQLTLALQ